MPDKPRSQISPFKFAGIHGRIAADVCKDAEYELRCRACDNNFPLPEYRFGEFLAKGWPKCCGQTMRLNKLEGR